MDVISRYGKNYKYNKWDSANWDGFRILCVLMIIAPFIVGCIAYYTDITAQKDRVYITRQLQTQETPIGYQLILEYKHLTKEDIDYAMSYGYEVVGISNLPRDRSLVVYRRISQ